MRSLVDSILPFEACLYYQIIPLSIDASHLNLGMVNPDDTATIDYVKRQVAYINYSLVTWPIASDWHRDVLSQYLSHKAKAKKNRPQPSSEAQATALSQGAFPVNPSDQATFIVDSPTIIPKDQTPSISSAGPQNSHNNPQNRDDSPFRPVAPARHRAKQSASLHASTGQQEEPLALELPALNLPMSFAAMGKLPPKQLTQALLNRVLQDGIGRLYFERRASSGRILWSKDGIVQAALEDLNLPLFQSVINELKRLTHLPLLTTQETRQVEIERTYRQERVVLRFRLIANPNGEEATLQVLRGAALKFYQQQQIDQLGREALTFAHRLQTQINQIRDRARLTFTLEGVSEVTLTTLSNLLKDIGTEIDQLIQQQKK
jgi:type II secretory ATPase GspE/PulE/Tfp pilus assembly ATPase PilB-like protein